jgi:CRP/FNR family transcriptional regulator
VPWPIEDVFDAVVTVPAGHVLFMAGDPVTLLYAIVSGIVIGSVCAASGREIAVSLRTHGWLLGAHSALASAPHYATARALTACTARTVALDPFLALAQRDARVGLSIARIEAREAHLRARLVQRFGVDAEGRLLQQLARLARAGAATRADGSFELICEPTHDQLAQLAMTSRETVTRLLGELCARGILAQTRRPYRIPAGSPLLEAVVDAEQP